jgi:hypothetical protein
MSGVNNFLQFDPNGVLILTDDEYTASLSRLNGVSSGQASAALHNKLFFQVSTFVKAFADAMSVAGVNAIDSNLNLLNTNITAFINLLISNAIAASILDGDLARAYPVGSIYMNVSNGANPHEIFGFGTWVACGAGKMLLGVGGTHAAGQTGGEETHTLTVNELPAHSHIYKDIYHAEAGGTVDLPGNFGSEGSDSDNRGFEMSRTTEQSGLSSAHNNMPPFLVVYMWSRIS